MRTLIAARPGAMQEILTFFLSSIGGIEVAGTASDSLSTLELIKAHRPALVVIDGNLPEEDVPDLVGQIKTGSSHPKVIVLANGTWQEQQLLTQGADAVLQRGVALTKILGVINQFISPNGCSEQISSYSEKGV